FANRIQLANMAFDGQLRQRVGFALNQIDRVDTNPNFLNGDLQSFSGQSRMLDYQVDADLTETNTLTAAAVYYAEQALKAAKPFQAAERGAQNQSSAFINDRFLLLDKKLITTAGFRWDDNSRAGAAQTYRFSSIYKFDTGTSLHGTLGTGFRAPALSENF